MYRVPNDGTYLKDDTIVLNCIVVAEGLLIVSLICTHIPRVVEDEPLWPTDGLAILPFPYGTVVRGPRRYTE